MTTLAITASERATPSRKTQAPRWRAVAVVGLAWYGAFALMLLGQALGLL